MGVNWIRLREISETTIQESIASILGGEFLGVPGNSKPNKYVNKVNANDEVFAARLVA